eukprot:9472602-Pyramimonas_sp.AAC.1
MLDPGSFALAHGRVGAARHWARAARRAAAPLARRGAPKPKTAASSSPSTTDGGVFDHAIVLSKNRIARRRAPSHRSIATVS